MAPSPELGGQPKAPDKAGADQQPSTPTTTATATEHSSSSTSSAPSPSSSSSNSNNPSQSSSSGTKHSPPTVVAAAAAAAVTSNSGSSSVGGNNNSSSSTSSGGVSAGAAGAVAGTLSAQATTPQQDSSKIDNMEESDLKALLEEAITYKRPKDREHKSATFNELLSKTEKEDQEQNFPFTSRAVQTKRASGRPTQGGSLQDLPEASLQEYYYSEFPFTADYGNRIGTFSQNWRRHQGGSSGAASVGPGGGDRATNPRQKRTTSSVSSRQREGGSLPSNVNVECSFFNDVGHHHTTGTITKFKKREGGSKSDYGTMVLTAPLITSAGAAELISAVAEVAGSTGLKNTESQLIDGCGTGVGSGHTVIDMGELESDETQSLLAHDALQQTLYDSGLDDYDGSGGDLYGSSTTTSGGSSTTGVGGGGGAGSGCSAMKKIPRYPAASYTSHVNLEIGEPSSTVRPSSVHHVDKTVSLPLLESNKSVDITSIQLGTTYPAVKCFVSSDNSKSDQTRVMMSSSNTKYIATQSIGQMISQQKCLDENGNSVQQFGSSLGSSSSAAGSAVGVGASGLVGSGGNSSSSVGGSGGGGGAGNAGSKKRKPKSDRNTVLVIPEKIAGYRGKDYDIESLVCYIENKDKQKDGGKAGGSGASGSNPKNGTVMKVSGSASVENGIPEEKVPKKKNEKKKEKGKLKKSNSLEELSSCSRKKQQAEEEQNTHKNHVVDQQSGPAQKSQDAESAVTLRGGKGNKKAQNSNVGSSIASSVSSASSTASSHSSKEPSLTSGGKRGERRSWGTEELSYLEDSHNQIAQIVEKAEEKPAKKDSRKEAKESAEAVTPTFNAGKKRDSLRMSVESLSAISGAGVGSETAEFHVVTKKKKMKKKAHSLFAEDTTSSSATGGYSNVASNANNRRHLTVSQSYNLGSSTTVRTSNISGKYQASNSFTNDRDVYMNSNDVSRRKSTSSVPPSEKSDSSDADSVQSLPIEPSRKQQQQQHQTHQSGASRHPSAGVPQSYADIARIPNADRINNNIIGATTSNSSTSPLDSSSVEKWPPVQATTNEDLAQALKSPSAFPELVPESSSLQPQQQQTVQSPNQPQQQQQQYQQQHQYVNSSVSSVNNLGNSNKATYSQSLLIATTKATAVEEDDSASRLHQQQRLAAASSGKLVSSVNNSEHSVNISSINNSSSSSSSKLALHKSKSVDTNDIYYSNEEHYPALEKTVKPAVKMAAAPTVTANSNSLLNELKTTSSITGGKVSPVGANAGQSQPTTTNAPATTVTTTVISGNPIASNVSTAGAKKSKKKDSVTNSVTTDPSIPANDVESINNARNVASSLDLVNNNPLLIENIDMDFPQNGMLNRSPNGGGQQPSLQSTPKNSSASSIPSSAALSKRSKKDKATMISQNSIANAAPTVTANSNHRPAVIIMNDHHNESGTSHEFTFGFDIDQELLFGDFQEDEVTSMLDQHHQYHHQQKTSPQHHNSTENVPSPTSAISNTSTDLGYSSMQQSSSSTTTASTGSPTSSNNSSLSSSHTTQPNKPPQQYHHHHHHQQYHNQAPTQPPQMEAAYDSVLHSSADPDTYRDGIEHKFHQPPPPMVPAMYTQPPPQLPPPHVLAAQQQQQQSARQPRTTGPNHYNLPPPPVVIPSHIQQQPPPALPVVAAKQDTATNTPAIMSVPPPPLPPVVVPATAAIPIVQAVILPAGPPPVATTSSSSNTNPAAVTAAAGVISSSSNNSSSSNIHTSLNNQTMASSSGSSSSINSCSSVSLQQEPKPQRQPAAVQPQQQQPQQQMQNSAQPPIREKIKEINLRFIAPDQLQTSHNHDKIVNFVGMAWEDVICGTNGSAKYYEGQ